MIVPDEWLADRATFESRCRDTGPEAVRFAQSERPDAAFLFGRWWARMEPDDDSVCPHLRRDGFWESWVSLAFARAVRPGARVLDCGAHVGWYTLLALARGARKVHVVEPQPALLAKVLGTVQDEGLVDRVDFTGTFAAGSAWGAKDLLLYGRLTGSASFIRAPGYAVTDTLRVLVAPLDALLDFFPWNEPGAVDLLKMDIEGAEADAWRGMQGTLARNPQATVVMEVGAERGYSLEAFLREIDAAGFRVRKVDYEGQLVPMPEGWLSDGRLVMDKDGAGEWATVWIDRREAAGEGATA